MMSIQYDDIASPRLGHYTSTFKRFCSIQCITNYSLCTMKTEIFFNMSCVALELILTAEVAAINRLGTGGVLHCLLPSTTELQKVDGSNRLCLLTI